MTSPNPIYQAAQWAREIDAMENMFRAISSANLHNDEALQPVITIMSQRLTARRAELKALASLYEGP